MEYQNGKTQYQAYIDAYPKAKNWGRNAIEVNASKLMQNTNILLTLKECGWKDKTEVMITRKNMLKRIDKLMKKHEEEVERIEKAYKQDEALAMQELSQWMQLLSNPNIDEEYKKVVQAKVNELTQKMIDKGKQRRLNAVNTRGINECAKIINRMMGFDITKVEITNIDSEREEMEKLTVDDLKELINISKKEE